MRKKIKCEMLEYNIYFSELMEQYCQSLSYSLGENVFREQNRIRFKNRIMASGRNYTFDNYFLFRYIDKGSVLFDRENQNIELNLSFSRVYIISALIFPIVICVFCYWAGLSFLTSFFVTTVLMLFLYSFNHMMVLMRLDLFCTRCSQKASRAIQEQLD